MQRLEVPASLPRSPIQGDSAIGEQILAWTIATKEIKGC